MSKERLIIFVCFRYVSPKTGTPMFETGSKSSYCVVSNRQYCLRICCTAGAVLQINTTVE